MTEVHQIRVEVNKIQAKIAEDEYRRTVFRAFEEVENALMQLSGRRDRRILWKETHFTVKRIHQQTEEKMKMGLISQLELLGYSGLLSTERSLADTHRAILDDTVTLCKALGGGWSQSDIQKMDISDQMTAQSSDNGTKKPETLTVVMPVSVSGTSARIQIRTLQIQEHKSETLPESESGKIRS
ncbi:MAG: hypothetical protein R2941_20765 [Desulfobacterales bacterium]